MIKKLSFLIVLFSFNIIVSAQVTQQWIAEYNNADGKFIKLDYNNNVIVAADSDSGIVLIKYSNTGVLMWSNIYRYVTRGVESLALDKNNDIYLIATTDLGINTDILTVKYNSQGMFKWVSSYSTQGNSLDLAVKVISDSEGNICVLGDVSPVQYDFKTLLIKYNPLNGDLIWANIYSELRDPIDMRIDNNNNIFVAGYGMKVLKCDTEGNMKWITNPGTGGHSISMTLDNKGNVYATGDIYGQGSSELDCITVKYDSSGTFKWVKTFTTYHYDCPYSIAADDSLNVFIAGYCTPNQGNYLRACLIVKYNAEGTKLWQKYFLTQTNYDDRFLKIIVDGYGNCYATGSACYSGPFGRDYLTTKYSSNGSLIWYKKYPGDSAGNSETSDIMLDSLNNLYITGEVSGRCVTIKYSQTVNIYETTTELPVDFSLSQNYPNPFNPVTKIVFSVPKFSNVSISVYDITGREVSVLVNEKLQPRTYETAFDGSQFPSGVYFCRMATDGKIIDTKKMVIVK